MAERNEPEKAKQKRSTSPEAGTSKKQKTSRNADAGTSKTNPDNNPYPATPGTSGTNAAGNVSN